MLQTNSLFQTAIENYTTEQIARRLGLHSNTVARWKEKNNVPSHYAGDFYRLLQKKENYGKFILNSLHCRNIGLCLALCNELASLNCLFFL